MLRWLVGTVLLFVAAGCSLVSGGGGVDGPVIHAGRSFLAGGEDAQIRGVITFDGECLHVGGGPAVWPHGTRWQEDPQGVVLPNGDIALIGDTVIGGGGNHKPEYVNELASATAAAKADECATAPNSRVAVFNPSSDITIE